MVYALSESSAWSDSYHHPQCYAWGQSSGTIVGSAITLSDALHYKDLAALLAETPKVVQRFLRDFRAILEIREPLNPVRLFHQSLPDF